MSDKAHEETDKILEKMEKKVAREYKKASKEVGQKLKKYLDGFKKRDAEMQKKLDAGEITQDAYNLWRMNQLATGDRWQAMRDTLAEDMVNANKIAKQVINGNMADVYSMNRNYAVYQVEKDAMIDTSFTLYNRKATEMLFKNDSSLLPMPREGSRAWQAMMNKDLRWNQQKINSSLIQGILQGESNDDIADRLIHVVGMNYTSAIRNARTMTTSVESRGRNDAYDELKEKGVELETVWVATLDDRTRHSHRQLHGEVKDEKTGKFSNGLRYPADPAGDPEEVYNCRCAEMSYVKGFPIDIPKRSAKWDDDMTFEKWLGEHEESAPVEVKAETKEEKTYPRTQSYLDGITEYAIKNNRYSEQTQEYINGTLESVASDLGITQEEAKEKLCDGLTRIVDESDFTIRINSWDLESVLDDGRFKNQFETGTSNATLDFGWRKDTEFNMFNIPKENGKNIDDSDRPVYGMLCPKWDASDDRIKEYYSNGSGTDYGNGVTVILDKNKVFNNVTMTAGDSLGFEGQIVPMEVNNIDFGGIYLENYDGWSTKLAMLGDASKSKEVIDTMIDITSDSSDGYFELQFHGKESHSADNISMVVIEESLVKSGSADGLIKKLKEKGIKYIINK